MAKMLTEAVQTRFDGAEPRYWPIESYGVIGDCRTAALIAPNGSIDWLCLPHFDNQASLCKLLDSNKGGFFQIRPADPCDSTMRYVAATNVLETTWDTDSGQFKTLDFMPIRKRQAHGRVREALAQLASNAPHMQRAHLERDVGNDVAAAHRVDRIVSCEQGEIALTITLKLTPDYARQQAHIELQPHHPHTISAVLHDDNQHYFLFIAKGMSPTPEHADVEALEPFAVSTLDEHLTVTVRLRAGQRVGVALNFARNEREARDILQRLLERDLDDDAAETIDYWQEWSDLCAYQGRYATQVLRSALALKLCVFEPTGAIVAAPTTSLPESMGGERNWDYRFTWLRDSSFTLQALGLLGYHSEARDYFHFLHDLRLKNGMDFRVLYTIGGEVGEATAEHELKHLEGYKGSRPVRIGNGAATQRQMDIYGELADAALLYAQELGYCTGERTRESPRDLRHVIGLIADYVADNWQSKDNGVWEERGPEQAFVYSRVMCWVALDRALTMTQGQASKEKRQHWSDAAEAIRADIHAHGYSDRLKTFTQAYDNHAVDAANFRIALVDYLPPSDERLRSTIATTGRILGGDEALIYRYRPAGDETEQGESAAAEDGLPSKEGSFLACAFWYVSNLALLDQVEEARTRFERLLRYASPLGLYSEELDVATGGALGNYPQAFTHIGMVIAARHLHMAEERDEKRKAEQAEKAEQTGQTGQASQTSKAGE